MRGRLLVLGVLVLGLVAVGAAAQDGKSTNTSDEASNLCTIIFENGSASQENGCSFDADSTDKLKIKWSKIETGETFISCFALGEHDPGDQLIGDWCTEKNFSLAKEDAKEAGALLIPFPDSMASEEHPNHEKSCSESLFQQEECNVTVALENTEGSKRISGTLQISEDLSSWAFPVLATLGGVVIATVAFLVLRKTQKRGAVRDLRDRNKSDPKKTAKEGSAGSTFTTRSKPVPLRIYDAQRDIEIKDRVSINAPEDKEARRNEDNRWVVPRAGPTGYKITVDAPGYETTRVRITDQHHHRLAARIELEPKTGTVVVDVKEHRSDRQLGNLPFELRSSDRTIADGTTEWTGPVRVPDMPFGTYQVVLHVPSLFQLASDPSRGDRGPGRVGTRVEVQPETTVTARFELEHSLPDLPLPKGQRERLNQAMDSLRSYDTFLPRFLERIPQDYGSFVNAAIRDEIRPIVEHGLDETSLLEGVQVSQEQLTVGIVDSITSRSNLSLFASTPQEGDPPDPDPLGIATGAVLVDRAHRESAVDELRERLDQMDERLTKLSRDLTIRPLADLLALGRNLLDDGASDPDPIRGGARILAADLCLGALDAAMQNPAFQPHLEGDRL